jgi:hypothetical protein
MQPRRREIAEYVLVKGDRVLVATDKADGRI